MIRVTYIRELSSSINSRVFIIAWHAYGAHTHSNSSLFQFRMQSHATDEQYNPSLKSKLKTR